MAMEWASALRLGHLSRDLRCKTHFIDAQECASVRHVAGSLREACNVRAGWSEALSKKGSCGLATSRVGERDDHANDSVDQSPARKGRRTKYSMAATVGSGAAIVQERNATQNGALLSVLISKEVMDEKKSLPIHESIGDIIKVGGLIDNGLVYREKFVIRCYEVGTNRTASMEAMANLLQEAACNHAQSVGFSTDGFATTPAMRKRHLIWVTTRMHIEIDEYPVWGQIVEIDTWFQGEAKIATRRDWLIRREDGRVIGRATSVWVMMNTETRRLCRIPDDVRAEYMDFVPLPPRWAIPGENTAAVRKIGALEEYEYSKSPLMARRSDLDMNQHVNNVTYMGWMLESMPRDIADNHELSMITLDYKRECKHDDVVQSMTSPEPVEVEQIHQDGNGAPINGAVFAAVRERDDRSRQQRFTHLLRLVDSGVEINRGRTEWRRKVTGEMNH